MAGKQEWVNPVYRNIGNAIRTVFVGTVAYTFFGNEMLIQLAPYVGGGLVLGGLAYGANLFFDEKKPIENELQIRFKACGLVTYDTKEPPQLISKEEKDYGYRLVYNIPFGKKLDDFISKKAEIFEPLNVDGEFRLSNGKIELLVYTHTLGTDIGFALPEDTKEKLSKMALPLYLGRNREGFFHIDLADVGQPHILMGGATGGGKSSTIRTILNAFLQTKNADEVKIIYIDFKERDANLFRKYPHPMIEIITKENQAITKLKEIQREFKHRGDLIMGEFCENLKEYNALMDSRRMPEKKLPYIFVIFDEFGLKEGNAVVKEVNNLAMKGRSDGIHLMLVAQLTKGEIVDTTIKGNLGIRIGFATQNHHESTAIITTTGCEKLNNEGRALIKFKNKLKEVQIFHTKKADIWSTLRRLSGEN